jgi:uncharacterized short protein YbdD (DUF466 family)
MQDSARDVTLSEARGPKPHPVTRLLAWVRTIAGMPNYGAYLEHLRRCHPESPVPSERLFYEEFIKSRYGDGPTRCC